MSGSDAIVIATILFLLLSAVVLIFMVHTMRKRALEYEEYSHLLEERNSLEKEKVNLLEEIARLGVEQVRREKNRVRFGAEILYNGNAYAINTDCYKIGSAPLCNLIIPDISVSNLHCEIVYDDNTFILSDLLAENGTYVNGERIARVLELHDGDEIRIGDAVMTFKRRNERKADNGGAENPSQQTE